MNGLVSDDTLNQYQSLITVMENTEVRISDAEVKRSGSKHSGAVLCGGYQRPKIEISDSNFTHNFAENGGVFCAEQSTELSCLNCRFSDNFALSSSIIRTS